MVKQMADSLDSQFLVILNVCKTSEIILKSASLIVTYFHLTQNFIYTHIVYFTVICNPKFHFYFHLLLHSPIISFTLLCWFCPFSMWPFVIAFVTSMYHSALNSLWHSWQINGITSGSSFFRKPDIKDIYSRWIHWLDPESKWHTTQVNASILV